MTETPIEYRRRTATDLGHYVNGQVDDVDYVAECWAEAVQLVDDHVAGVDVPPVVLDRAYMEVGSELFHRRQAPSGVAQFTGLDGTPVRVARDPMVSAYPILARYVGLGIA